MGLSTSSTYSKIASPFYSQSTELSEIEQMSNLDCARLKISHYTLQNRGEHEDLVQRSLGAFLDHLPDAGRDSIAKDIVALDDDNGIYRYFRNLYTGLRTRSEFLWIVLKKLLLTSSLE
jgi:hypothetical protein